METCGGQGLSFVCILLPLRRPRRHYQPKGLGGMELACTERRISIGFL